MGVKIGTIVFYIFVAIIAIFQSVSTIMIYVARDAPSTVMSEDNKKNINSAVIVSWTSLILAVVLLVGYRFFGCSLSNAVSLSKKTT